MLTSFLEDRPWFAPKSYGIGAGKPISWQGWALTALHVLLVVAVTLVLVRSHPRIYHANRALLVMIEACLLGLPAPLYAAKTRGGWKWRWGQDA